MSVSHGYSTIGGIECGGCETKRRRWSHWLGVSKGYGDAHQYISMWMSRDYHATDALRAISVWKLKRKTSGCAPNLLAQEDLGKLRKPIIGIYRPSYIMKIPTSIWRCPNERLFIMKNMVLLWSTSVEKDSSIVTSLFFSLFFCLGSLASFHISFFLWATLAFFFYFLTWDNALIMMIITLLFTYNSILRTIMTLYEMPPAVYRDVQRSSLAYDVETSR